tara:strand:+ start:531 stop:1208 length:678 start_codon:yes stop_codon:yes gene_type:complete
MDALRFGSYIHKILEDGVKATTMDELNQIAEIEKPNYEFSKSYTPKIEKCLRNFLRFNASLNETVGTELTYEIDLDEEKNIKQNGIIDRVVKGKDGGYLVIDYKTSKREKTKFDLYQDTQLKGYCYAIHKMYNVPIGNIVMAHYYPITDNFVHVSYTSSQIRAYTRTIIDEVWKIRKSKMVDLGPCRNEYCNWCAYKSLCPLFADSRDIDKKIQTIKEERKAKKL